MPSGPAVIGVDLNDLLVGGYSFVGTFRLLREEKARLIRRPRSLGSISMAFLVGWLLAVDAPGLSGEERA